MMTVGFVLLTTALVVVALVFAHQNDKKREAAWALSARELGLTYDDQGELHGEFGGMGVRIARESRGSGKSQHWVTVFEASIDGAPLAIKLSHEHFGIKLLKGAGLKKEHQIGDKEFDDKFLIEGPSAGRLREWLTGARKNALLGLLVHYREVRFQNDTIHAAQRDGLGKPGELRVSFHHFIAAVSPLLPHTIELREIEIGQDDEEEMEVLSIHGTSRIEAIEPEVAVAIAESNMNLSELGPILVDDDEEEDDDLW